MIRIRVRRHTDGLEISAVGHAGYAERGRDIVCAGVSALLWGLVRYLQSYGGEEQSAFVGEDSSGGCSVRGGGDASPTVECQTGDGALRVRTHGMRGADMAAWCVTRAGLLMITEEYPTHVALREDDYTSNIFMKRKQEYGHGNHRKAPDCR